MRQAIEEGFIHDVLKNYVTYDTYFQVTKTVTADPEVDSKKAKKAIARFVSLHPTNLSQKQKLLSNTSAVLPRTKLVGKPKRWLSLLLGCMPNDTWMRLKSI